MYTSLPPLLPSVVMFLIQAAVVVFAAETLRRPERITDNEILAFGIVILLLLCLPMAIVKVLYSFEVVRQYFSMIVGLLVLTCIAIIVGLIMFGIVSQVRNLIYRAYLT